MLATMWASYRLHNITVRPTIDRRYSRWSWRGTGQRSDAAPSGSHLSPAAGSLPCRSTDSTLRGEPSLSQRRRRRRLISSGTCVALVVSTGWQECFQSSARASTRSASFRLRSRLQSSGRNGWATSWSMLEAGDRTVLLKKHVQRARTELHETPARRCCCECAAIQGLATIGERKRRARRVIPRDYITEWREWAPWNEGIPSRARPGHQPSPGRDILRSSARRGTCLPRRYGALQTLPDAVRALLRRYRLGSAGAWTSRPGDGRLAKCSQSLAWTCAVKSVAVQGNFRLPVAVRGCASDSAAPEGREQCPRAFCGGVLHRHHVLG